MKKAIIFFVVMTLLSCNDSVVSKYGKGGQNAVQYLRERTLDVASEIESIEVTGVDTLLSDVLLTFGSVEFARAGADFWDDKISKEDYQENIDIFSQTVTDITNSWMYPMVVNDSLRKLSKYDGAWRVVFEITTTMKSTSTKTTRVLMDNDGITPRMTEKEFTLNMNEWTEKIVEAQRDLYKK